MGDDDQGREQWQCGKAHICGDRVEPNSQQGAEVDWWQARVLPLPTYSDKLAEAVRDRQHWYSRFREVSAEWRTQRLRADQAVKQVAELTIQQNTLREAVIETRGQREAAPQMCGSCGNQLAAYCECCADVDTQLIANQQGTIRRLEAVATGNLDTITRHLIRIAELEAVLADTKAQLEKREADVRHNVRQRDREYELRKELEAEGRNEPGGMIARAATYQGEPLCDPGPVAYTAPSVAAIAERLAEVERKVFAIGRSYALCGSLPPWDDADAPTPTA